MPPKRHVDPGTSPTVKRVRRRDQNALPGVEYREATVKMALGSWIRDGHEDLHVTIHDAVFRTTRIAFEGSKFLNLMFIDLEGRGEPFPKMDQTFLKRVFFAVAATPERNRQIDPAFVDPLVCRIKTELWEPLVADFAADDYSPTSRRGLDQILNYTARKFQTAAMNHVTTNIHTWIQRYLLWKIRKHSAVRNVLMGKELSRHIAGHLVQRVLKFHDPKSRSPLCSFALTPGLQAQLDEFPGSMEVCKYAFDKVQKVLDGRSINPFWVEKNWQQFWPILAHLRRRNEKHRNELKLSLEGLQGPERKRFLRHAPGSFKLFTPFNLLPDFSAQAKYIDVDNESLFQLMAESHERFARPWDTKLTLASYRNQNADDVLFWWRYIFKIEKVSTRHRIFALRFATDGTGVSIGVRVPVSAIASYEPRLPTPEELEGKTVIGVDEGRIDLWVASDGTQQVSKGSNKEYYHRAGFIESRLVREEWKRHRGIDVIETSIPPSRVTHTADYLTYLRYLLPHASTLMAFYCAKRYKRLRFKAYMGRQKAQNEMVDKFLADIRCEPQNLIVGFGAAKFAHNSVGHAASLNGTWLRRGLRRRGVFVTSDIDEYLTSQKCSKCEQQLPKKTRFWQIKSCPGPCLTCWNRDVNAATNMRSVLLHLVQTGQRPEVFRRSGIVIVKKVVNDLHV